VQFSIDMRAPDDSRRAAALADVTAKIHSIAVARDVRATVAKTHEADAFVCDPRIAAGLTRAVEEIGVAPRLLPSGAGHDAMVMGGLCPAGMLFVRCKGGISHNPLESITLEDCAVGLAALTRFVRDFRAS
jgi:acetylornithine deacetylase/succinyl-diaminopimelate desuccinylase-like protein